ncbi:MAG: GxxExxY protein [Rhabdochlamydiaceae bacterium]|nr:GxxExxY protein [Rhabdochlamydiaceae bacterium]
MNFSTTREQSSLEITELTEGENSLTGKIGAAIDVHRTLGPGLLESDYEAQLMSYLKLPDSRYGLWINFNVKLLREGIRRFKI